MYQVVTVMDEISVSPEKFGIDLEKAVTESIEEKYEGKLNNEIGVVLAVAGIDEIGEGRILPEDPSVHYKTKFKLLTWMPKIQEIVEGEVVDVTEFGAFIRCGALDGLVHVSQVMDDFVSYDGKNNALAGKQSRRILKQGDAVRARIISVSFRENNKVGLTMRQPLLGSLKWLEAEEKEKAKKPKEEKPKKEKSKSKKSKKK